MNRKRYHIVTFLRALIVTPVVVSIVTAYILLCTLQGGLISLISAVAFFTLLFWCRWYSTAKKNTLPESIFEAISPVVAAFCYYMAVWVIFFGRSHYQLYDYSISTFDYATITYFVANLFIFTAGNYYLLFPGLQMLVLVISSGRIFMSFSINKKKIYFDKFAPVCFVPVLCFLVIIIYQTHERNLIILADDNGVELINDEASLSDYKQFSESPLIQTTSNTSFMIDHDYPKISGIMPLYPAYRSIAQSVYQGVASETLNSYISYKRMQEAYELLIEGNYDILFGVQPSLQQQELAKEKGVELTLTPIAKEALVFFVHKDNPIDSLTIEQIQDIYRKETVNWKKLGGNNERIMPFQRPANSSSQAIMLAEVMAGKELSTPLQIEYASFFKSGVYAVVAPYRNYASAIGYSFRYYATEIKPSENIKILSINGINPTVENIKNGDYPFTIDVYAVTAGTTNQHVEPLINWILSEQGQTFIEKCGYVRYVQR